MKYKILLLTLIFILITQGCSKTKDVDYVKILESELPFSNTVNEIKFSTTLSHIPTIKYMLQNEQLYFAVDSASVDNYLLGTESVKKIVPHDIFNASKKILQTSSLFIKITLDNLEFFMDPNGILSAGKLRNPYDGFLGLTYLEQYKNVVFDYKNNVILFNQDPICDNELPMYKNNFGWYTIFECNGIESNALIDTGCFSVFINKQNVKNTIKEDLLINVKLGKTEINNITLRYNENFITNENARNTIFKNENVIGYPCFKDHVIQLDFENNIFRIK